MKKLIGVIGVVAIAMTMFFTTGFVDSGDLKLQNLMSLNVANAESVVCSVSNPLGKVIMTCSTSDTNCSESKAGYTLTCNNAKLD